VRSRSQIFSIDYCSVTILVRKFNGICSKLRMLMMMIIIISLFIYQLLLTIDASNDANILIINTNMKLNNNNNNEYNNDNIIKINNVIFSLSGCVLMKIMIKLNIQLYIDYFTINPVIIIDNDNDNVYNDNIYIQLYLLSSKTYYFITKILTNDKNINNYNNASIGNSNRIINHDISLSYDILYYLQFDLLYLRMIDAYSLTKYSSTEIHCTFHHNRSTTNNDSNTNSSLSIFNFLVSTTTNQNNHDTNYYHLKNMTTRKTYELIKTLHGDNTTGIISSGMTRNSIISKSIRSSSSSSSGINNNYNNGHQHYHGWQMFLKDDKLLSSTLSLTDLINTSTFNYIYPSSSLSSFSRSSSSSLLSISSSSTSSSTSTSIYKQYINLNQTSKLTKQLQQCLTSNKVLFLGDSHMEKNVEYLLKYNKYLYKQWYFMKDGHGIYMKLFHNYHYHEHKNTVSNDKIGNGYSHHHHHHKIQHIQQQQNNKMMIHTVDENQKHVNRMNNNIYKKNDNEYYQKIERTSRYLNNRKNPAIKNSIINRDDKIKNSYSKNKTHDYRIDENDSDTYEYVFLNSNTTISSIIDNQIKNKNIIIFKTGRLLTRLRDLTYDHLINSHNYQKIIINSGSWDLRDININYYIKHIDELFDELLLFRLRHDHNHQLHHQRSSNIRRDYHYNHNIHLIWMSTPSYSFRKPYTSLSSPLSLHRSSIIGSNYIRSSSTGSSSSSLNMIERRTNVKIAIAEQYIENKCREYNITYVPYFDISIVFHRYSIDTHHYIDNDSKVMTGQPHIGLIQLNYLLNAICNTS
jgi:hypothetical protein